MFFKIVVTIFSSRCLCNDPAVFAHLKPLFVGIPYWVFSFPAPDGDVAHCNTRTTPSTFAWLRLATGSYEARYTALLQFGSM